MARPKTREGTLYRLPSVAPNPDLHAPVVATAWTAKLTCTDVDRAALKKFVQTFAGKGAGHA